MGVTAFDMPKEACEALLQAARTATKILIRGRTDSMRANPVDQRIALGRAAAARRFLISNGIAPERIVVFFRSAGGFAVDNTTMEGKARNRRVEIETVGVNTEALGKRT